MPDNPRLPQHELIPPLAGKVLARMVVLEIRNLTPMRRQIFDALLNGLTKAFFELGVRSPIYNRK